MVRQAPEQREAPVALHHRESSLSGTSLKWGILQYPRAASCQGLQLQYFEQTFDFGEGRLYRRAQGLGVKRPHPTVGPFHIAIAGRTACT